MRKTQTTGGRWSAGAWVLVALLACALTAGAAAQSGRRRTPQQSPTPQPSPEATPEGESESESRPRGAKDSTAGLSFIVMDDDGQSAFHADSVMRTDVVQSFAGQLRRSASVSVTDGGRGSRSDARDRAKGERTAFVVLVTLEGDYGAVGVPRGSEQSGRSLVVRTVVFEPKTGAIKHMDTVYQRPVRQTATIGGIGIPVPTRTINRYPSEHELRQAARDAADRLLSRFQVVAPPNQP